jgi:hypothetical protein
MPQSLRRFFCATFSTVGVAACAADTELDRIYIDSLHYARELSAKNGREFLRWYAEHEQWKRGELGRDAPEPVRPQMFYNRESEAARMRFMERELVSFLERSCTDDSIECVSQKLAQLDFKCDEATPIECLLNNVAHADYYDYFARHTERHAWIVTVSQDVPKPFVQVRAILLPRTRY